jgi:DNA polymerase-3 subunit delta'
MAEAAPLADSPAPTPRENAILIGHEAAERSFVDAWRSGRLAHAWLIAGPRGIGKATLAFRCARFVLVQEPGGPDRNQTLEGLALAPSHPVFRRVASGGHTDLQVAERGFDDKGRRRAEIVVDQIRTVNRFLALTPGEGEWRVVIVDSADELNRNAANALLKLLEEPPARSLFLLVSHAPARLPATILSRCRRLTLRPLPDEALAAVLAAVAPWLPAEDAHGLGRLAEGSPGRALALAEQGGLALYRELIRLLDELPALDVRALHRLGDRMSGRDGIEVFRTLTELLTWWLGRLVEVGAQGEGAGQGAEVVPGEAALRRRFLARRDLDQWVEVWEKLGHLFARAEAVKLEPKQVLLNAFHALQQAARP